MTYIKPLIECEECGNQEYYVLDIISPKGDLRIEDDYIICEKCNARYYIGDSEVDIGLFIKAKRVESL